MLGQFRQAIHLRRHRLWRFLGIGGSWGTCQFSTSPFIHMPCRRLGPYDFLLKGIFLSTQIKCDQSKENYGNLNPQSNHQIAPYRSYTVLGGLIIKRLSAFFLLCPISRYLLQFPHIWLAATLRSSEYRLFGAEWKVNSRRNI